MKRNSLFVMLFALMASVCAAQDNFFPIAAVLSNGTVPYNSILDTTKAAGFNATWMGGFDNSNSLLGKLDVYKSKGLKAVVHYPVYPGNPKYNLERFASGVHYRFQPETDSIFNKGTQFGYVDGNCWSSDSGKNGFMVYWDSAACFDWGGRWMTLRNYENRTPANYGPSPFNLDTSIYHVVFRLKYSGININDSVCMVRWVKRRDHGYFSSIPGDTIDGSRYAIGERLMTTADFPDTHSYATCTLSYSRTNGESRWFDYEVKNCGNYKVSVDYIDIYDGVYDSLANNIIDTLTHKRYSDYINDIAGTYSDTSVVYRFYMQDEPVRSQLDAYRLVDQRLQNSGTVVRGLTNVVSQYPTSFGQIGYSNMADTTFYSNFVTAVKPAELMVDILPLLGDGGKGMDGFETSPGCYRTPVDSGSFLQKQFDIHAKYCRAANRAGKMTSPETPFWVQIQCCGDSLSDNVGNVSPLCIEGRWRPPTPRELKCMAYLSLAHGSKGLCYYTFSDGLINYSLWGGESQYWKLSSVVDVNGVVKNPDLYAAVKEINGRANIWATTLLNLTCDQTFRKQDGNIPIGTFITGVSDSLVQVGLFHYKTKINDKYFMLVNRHCLPTETLIITVNISNARQFIVSDVLTGQIVTYAMPAGDNIPFRYTLQPGEGRLFHILQQ